MKGIDKIHPFTVILYYILVISIVMFQMNPIIVLIAFVGVILANFSFGLSMKWKERVIYLMLFLILSLINPIFSHKGQTVLFYLSGMQITIEAVCYGCVMAGTIITVLLWCRQMSSILTSDKVLYLIGKISMKFALILSMTLRFIPQYKKQSVAIRQTQKVLGLYKEDTLPDKLRGNLYVFSAMVTWAFEHSVETSDSMQGRAYGTGKRTQYHDYKIRKTDVFLILCMVLLGAIHFYGMVCKKGNTVFYPTVYLPAMEWDILIHYMAYGFLICIIPIFIIWERIKWNFLLWKN